jgi:hypothetical protein
MVAVPAEMPVTTPPLVVTVAIAVLLLLHVPPGVALANVVAPPIQTASVPVIGVVSTKLTVSVLVAVAVPHPVVTV